MTFIDVAVAIVTLTSLEIILCVDNVIFLTILTDKLSQKDRLKARYWGLTFAWVARLFLLSFAVYLVRLNEPLFVWNDIIFSVRTLFLGFGGFFLMAKATQEIHNDVEKPKTKKISSKRKYSFWPVVMQVGLMDVVFSLDSVLTAVGLTNELWIMATAITISILAMLYLSKTIADFIARHPSIKMLALCFLLFIGVLLVADGLSFHMPREYLYVAMAFSLTVESLNFLRKKRKRG